MTTQRTGGMTTIAILNIIFGAFAALGFLFATALGGFITAAGAASGDAGTTGAATTLGGLTMIIGVVGLICAALLIISGIGVLKLAPWGRTLSIVCGAGFVLLNGFTIVGGEFQWQAIVGIAYGVLLVALFMQPTWKAAFATGAGHLGGQRHGTSVSQPQSDQYRHAA